MKKNRIKEYFDAMADARDKWSRRSSYYHKDIKWSTIIEEIYADLRIPAFRIAFKYYRYCKYNYNKKP